MRKTTIHSIRFVDALKAFNVYAIDVLQAFLASMTHLIS